MIIMGWDDFVRLNTLSEKAINDIATRNELEEFSQLLTTWNESIQYNLLKGLYVPNSNG